LTTNKSTKNGVERITSAGHDRAGKEPAKSLCSRWPTLGIDVIHAAEVLTTEHMQIGSLFRAREDGHLTDVPYANAVRKLLKRIHPLPWRVLLLVSESDHLGSDSGQKKSDTYEAGAFFEETIERKKLDQDPTKPLIQGRDLLELGFSPGPKVGFYIKRIEAARDQGQIENRAEALELLRNILGEEGS
ncbi:MAG TPA: hypothetical protein VFQ60_01255, partial [Patescibacteria group bacterium]|nr:hypothetical protein [Patescibacteria group bacterium]